MNHRARELDLDLRVRNQVFYGLGAADRFAELRAVLRVGNGHVDTALAKADHLCSGQQSAAICRITPAVAHFGRRTRRPFYPEQGAERIETVLRGKRDSAAFDDVEIFAIGQDQRLCDIGIGHEWIGRMAHRDNRAIHRARQPALVVSERGQQRDRDPGGIDQWFRQPDIACRLGNADQIGQAHAHAPGTFGGQQAQQAHLADRLPTPAVDCARFGQSFAQVGRGAGFQQHVARRLGDGDLVVGKGKLHGDQALGRPSMRSAMMLRWISFDPA